MPGPSPFVFIRFAVPAAPHGEADGPVPSMEADPSTLIGATEVVVPEPRASLVFDFPFARPLRFDFDADTEEGFTRAHLLRCAQRWYRVLFELYADDRRGSIVPYSDRHDGAEGGGPSEGEAVDLGGLCFEGADYVPGSGVVLLVVGG